MKELDPLFKQYYRGALSDEDTSAFKDRLDQDEEFREEYEEYELGMLAGERLLFKEIEKRVKDHSSKITVKNNRSVVKRRKLTWLTVSAVLLLLALVSTWFLLKPKNPVAIYAQYYEAPIASYPRGQSSVGSELDLLKAYQLKKYDDVVTIYEIFESDTSSLSIKRLLAHSYLQLGEETKATTLLKQTAEQGENEEKWLDEWYLGMIYLKEQKLDSARFYLRPLTNYPGFLYADEAAQIIKFLK